MKLIPLTEMKGEDAEDSALLHNMASDAMEFLKSHSWSPPISAAFFGFGVGGVVAIFLMEFSEKVAGTDDKLWVVVGDIPSAYLVVESDDGSQEAMERYCILMDAWINAVLSFGDFENVFPVKAPRTATYAQMLRSRLDFIRAQIIPAIPQ